MLKMHIPVIQQHKQDLVKDDTFDSGFTSTWGSQWKQVSLVGNLTQSHYVCSCEYVRMHVHCAAADISWDLWGWQRRAEVENNFQLLQGLNQTHTQTQLSRGRKNKQEAQVVLYVKAADDLCSSFDSGVVNDLRQHYTRKFHNKSLEHGVKSLISAFFYLQTYAIFNNNEEVYKTMV